MRLIVEGAGDKKSTGIGELEVLDTKVMRWRSGKVFVRYLYKDLIEALAKDMCRNVADGYDNVVVCEGPEGSGKSNLMYHVLSAYQLAHTGREFDLEKQYTYEMEEFKEKLREGDSSRTTYWMDEGSNIANNRDWNTQGNKDLVAFLEMMRSRSITFGMCIPHHERLDVYIREHRIRYLLRCGAMDFDHSEAKPRGYFELKKRNEYGRMITIGYGTYDPMPEEAKKTYEAIKLRSQEKKITQITDGGDAPGAKYKKKYEEQCKKEDYILLKMYNAGVDREELMETFGISSMQVLYNRISKARKALE